MPAAIPGVLVACECAGMALAYIDASTFVGLWSPREGVPKGRAAAEKAIALDPTLAEAYVAMANTHVLFDWDWPRGEQMIGRALELNPRSIFALYTHAAILVAQGRYNEAAAEQARAVELDPLSAALHDGLGWVYWVREQHERAIPHFHRAIELDRNYPVSYRHLGYAYLFSGRVKEALAEFQSTARRLPDSPVDYTNLGYALGFAGRLAEARQVFADLDRLGKKRYVSRIYAAYIHLMVGERAQALDSLENAVADRDGALVWNLIEPYFAPLRSEPRFRAMAKEVGVVIP